MLPNKKAEELVIILEDNVVLFKTLKKFSYIIF